MNTFPIIYKPFIMGKTSNLSLCLNDYITNASNIKEELFILAPCTHYIFENSNYCGECGMYVKNFILILKN